MSLHVQEQAKIPKNNNGTLVPAITSHLQISWQKMYTKKLNLLRLSFVVKHFLHA